MSGSTRALQPKRGYFLRSSSSSSSCQTIINFVNEHSMQLNISTVTLFQGKIHHLSMNTKRVQVGAEVGYAGPLP